MEMLTSKQAFAAMILFLENYYEQTKTDDIAMLLGELLLLEDGQPSDPAAWEDWTEVVQQVLVAAQAPDDWTRLEQQRLMLRITPPNQKG